MSIEFREVYDSLMYVVYDSKGNRRGAFDSEWDAEGRCEHGYFLTGGTGTCPMPREEHEETK